MNKEQLMDTLRERNGSEQFDIVLKLGAALTVAARAAYPASNPNIEYLVGFNEMQHRVYGWLRPRKTKTSIQWSSYSRPYLLLQPSMGLTAI